MKNYAFTKEGIRAFLGSVIGEILDRGNYYNISVTIGNDNINVPMLPEIYENLEDFLNNSLENWEEE